MGRKGNQVQIDILVVTQTFFIEDQKIIKKPVKLDLMEGGILYRHELNDGNTKRRGVNDAVVTQIIEKNNNAINICGEQYTASSVCK